MKREIKTALANSKKSLENFFKVQKNEFLNEDFASKLTDFDIVMCIGMEHYGFIQITDKTLFSILHQYDMVDKTKCDILYVNVKQFLEGEYLKEVNKEIKNFEHGKF